MGQVLISVPPQEHPAHRLEVARRGHAFEIAYECGQPGLRAVATFGLRDRAAAVFCVCEFLREFRDGEMVVLLRRLPLLDRRRRAGGARYRAQFRNVGPSARYSPTLVYRWPADPNRTGTS